jgi:hypothetical protein
MNRIVDEEARFLKTFEGRLQCDGCGAYDRLGRPGITYAGCWVHVRRKFFSGVESL